MHKLIALAQTRGSTAKTLAGAKKYLLANLPSPIAGLRLNKYSGRRAEPDYRHIFGSYQHERKLSRAQYMAHASMQRSFKRAQRTCAAFGLSTRAQLHNTKSTYQATSAQLAIVRILAGAHAACPVYIGLADNPPTETGSSYHKTRWSYRASTLRVEVGEDWIKSIKGKYQLHPNRVVIYLDTVVIHGITLTRYWSAKTRGGTVCGYIASATGHDDYHSLATSPHAAVVEAVAAWKKQAEIEAKRLAQNAQLSAIWVSADDSLRAGNCSPITNAVAEQIKHRLGGDVGAVRADYLIAMRDDSYVRRAITAAQTR